MTLSEELTWRGFVHQTTLKDIVELDGGSRTFYFGVDPSASSMTIGNLASAMMVKVFMKHGYKPVLLIGGATGLIGDPDGKSDERNLKTLEEIQANKQSIADEYRRIFNGQDFQLVDNYDWFQGMGYLQFLRDVGKHVPMRQMLSRDFIQTRLGEEGTGISYAEFSYVLIQAYDFLHLYRDNGVTLQLCGSDQWGNSIAGVELIRRIEGGEAHVLSTPLVVNKSTGKKFGKTEEGAVWLNPELTTPTAFYQFWINLDDDGVEDYLKVYTDLDEGEIDRIMEGHNSNRSARLAQSHLAREVTKLVHGIDATEFAEVVTGYLVGNKPIGEADEDVLVEVRQQLSSLQVQPEGAIADALVATNLASSLTEARRLIHDNAISVNGQKVTRENFEPADFANGRALLKKGKKFKDSALLELL